MVKFMLNKNENEVKTKNAKSEHTTESIIAFIFGIIAIITGFLAKQKGDNYGKYGLI